jgi:hypothetical protein
MPPRILNRDEDLRLDLRMAHARRHLQAMPRLPTNLRALGAVGRHVHDPGPTARGAVVKAWITRAGSTASHLYYLQHHKGEEGSDAPLYTRMGEGVDVPQFIRDTATDPHQFRFVVSITDAGRLNLQPVVQTLMTRMGDDLGRPLDWVAATHHDTPHKHAHVVVRGRDLRGETLYLMRAYLAHGLRFRAREVATEFLGPVPAVERNQERDKTTALETAMAQEVADAKKGGTPMEDDHSPPKDRNLDSIPDQPTTPALDQPTLMQRLTAVLHQIEARQEARAQDHEQGMEV